MADGWEEFNVLRTQATAATVAKWRRETEQLKMSRIVGEAYKKDMKAGLLIHRISDAECSEKQEFKALKEKTHGSHMLLGLFGRKTKIGGEPRESIFTFLTKLLKHELKRTDDNLTNEILRQKNKQIEDESVKASNRPKDTNDLTMFRKKNEKKLTDVRPDSVKIAKILAGDVELASLESHRAWALWSNAATVIKDISAVRKLVTFTSSGSPHLCAHAAAALHSLSKDPAGINLVINAGGVAALMILAAFNDEFVDGLEEEGDEEEGRTGLFNAMKVVDFEAVETCREEAILGLHSIVMRSAQGRERVSKDGALRIIIKIAGNRNDPMCYLADEVARKFKEIEAREKLERAAKADAKNRVRPRNADS